MNFLYSFETWNMQSAKIFNLEIAITFLYHKKFYWKHLAES